MRPFAPKILASLTFYSAILLANSPPHFTMTVQDTIAHEDRFWNVWLEASDPDDDPLTFALLPGAPAGMQINSSSGWINWTPTNLDVGDYTIVAEVSDGSLKDYLQFNLHVRNMNDPPVWSSVPPSNVTLAEDSLFTFTLRANDDDAIHGDVIHYILKLAPSGATIEPLTGTVTWRPDNRHVGLQSFAVWAQDDSAATIQTIWNIQVTNSPVTFTNSPQTVAQEDQPYSFDLQSCDENQGNIAYSFVTGYQPDWLTLDARTGVLSGTPNNLHVGTDSVKVLVNDGNGSQAILAFRLTVLNSLPSITTTILPHATEDSPYSSDIQADDEGLGNTSYRFLPDVQPPPSWLNLDAVSGAISGTPNNAHVGFTPFAIEFNDGKGGKDTTILTIAVDNVRPIIDRTNLTLEVTEDNLYTHDFNCSDDGQGTILYNSLILPNWLSLNALTGVLSGTPRNEHVGSNYVKIYVNDGNVNGTDTLDFTITVHNRAPQLLSTPVNQVNEDANYSYDINFDDEGHGATYYFQQTPNWPGLSIDAQTGLITGIPANHNVGSNYISVIIDDGNGGIVPHQFTVDVINIPPRFTPVTDQSVAEDQAFSLDIQTDDEGAPVIYVLRNPPTGMTINANSGLIQWTPNNSQVATYPIKVVATDDHGGSDSLTFNLQVTNVAPVITSTPFTRAREDSLYLYNVESTDEGVGTTTYSLATPISWLSIDPATGVIQGTPRDTDVGTYNINVIVNDGNGGFANQAWTITVYNLAPTITTDVISAATEDSYWEANLSVYPESGGQYTWSIQGAKPAWLQIDAATGKLFGTPTNSAVGRSTIIVRVTDLNGDYGEKNLTLDVVNINPNFTTTAVIHATEDQALSYDLNTDDEGDEGTGAKGYTLITYPSGWLTYNATTGVLSGTPRDTDVGTAQFVAYYQDGNGGVATLNTQIVVSNTPPQITSLNPPTTVNEDQFYSYQFTSDDDPWGNVTYSSLYTLPTGLTLSPAGLLQGTPKNTAVGVHSIGVIAADATIGKDTLIYHLQIQNVAPTITGLSITPSPYSQNGDTIFVTEDLPYQFDFSADDELDGVGAIYTVQNKPVWLTLTNSSTGVLSGTPTNAHVGVANLTITFSDGNGGSNTKTYKIKVNNVAPQFTNTLTSTTAYEDQDYQLDLNSTDDGQDSITYSILSGNPGWLQIDPVTGIVSNLSGHPDNDDVTAGVPVNFKVEDSNGGSDTLTVIFIVHNMNDAPVWSAAPSGIVTAPEDANYTTTIVASDVDVGDHLTYSFLQNPTTMTINATSGLISWTPTNANVGDHIVTVKAVDDSGASITRTWTVRVTNTASPIAALTASDFSPSAAVTAVVDTFYIYEDTTYTINFSAPDEGVGANCAYSFDEFSNPNWVTLTNSASGIVRLTPTNSSVGLRQFKIFFTDQPSSADTATIFLRVLNVPPVITTTGPFTAAQGQAFRDSIRCTDHGSGNITYSFLSGKPAWLSLDANTGILTGTPGNSDVIANGSFTIKVSDGNGGEATRAFNYSVINVNDPPIWSSAPSGTVTTAEDALYTTTLVATDIDVSDVLTYSLLSKPAGMTINATSGVITWTPDNSQVGEHTITAKASDLAGASITRTWTVRVTNTASPIAALTASDFSPSAAVTAVVDTFYIYEDTTYTINFSAPDEGVGANCAYNISELVNPQWISLTNTATGSLRLTPLNQHIGLDSIQIRFYDQLTSINYQKIYVRVVNTQPTLFSAGPFTATEDTPFEYDLDNSDEISGLCSYSFLSGKPTWLNINASTGVLSGTPTNADVGSYNFTIQVSDGKGGSATQSYALTVINTNDPPFLTAPPDTSIPEDALFTYNLVANDIDAGDVLTYSLTTAPSGMTINSSSGKISWTPNNSHVGANTVVVKVQDSSGASDSKSFTITVQNVLPVFDPISTTILTEDVPFSFDVNCSDEGYGVVTYSLVSPPSWLSINPTTGLLTGTPVNNHVGSQSVTIRVHDGTAATTSVWNFTVLNAPPVFTTVPDTTADEDVIYAYDANSSDDNQGQIRYSALTLPSWLSLDSLTGVLTGTPRNENVGDTLVIIKVTDGNGGSATQSFNLHIINTNDPPQFTSSPITIAKEDTEYRYTLSASDPDGDLLTFSLIQAPANMTVNSASGLIRWTPDNSHSGSTVNIQARVADSFGAQVDQHWTITVTNNPPHFTTQPAVLYATEDASFNYDFNTDDENKGNSQYSILKAPAWLTLINPATGQVSGIPRNNHVTNGDSLCITFSDGNGGSDTLNTLVAVANVPPVFITAGDTTATEGAVFSRNLQCDDESYGTVNYQALTPLPAWLSLSSSTGVLSGTPRNGDVGTTALQFRVFDSHSGFSDLSFNLTVANTPPHFVATPTTNATEDSLYTFDCNLSDESGNNSFALSINPGWLTINVTTGRLTGTPRNNHVGDNQVKIVANDGNGGTDSLTFIISVINSPPRITTTPPTTAQEDLLYSVDLNCTDENQGQVAYTALQKPAWLNLNQATGMLSGTPLNQHVTNAATVKIMVNDGHSGYDTLEYVLTVLNTAPQITHFFTDTILVEDNLFTYNIESNDEGQGATFYSFVGNSLPWLTLDSLTGELRGTPLNQHVTNAASPIQVQVNDGNGGIANALFFITVQNNPPVFVTTPSDSITLENKLWSYNPETSDEEQGTTNYVLLGTYPDWLQFDSQTGLLSGIPNNNQVDTNFIQIRFSDGNGGTATQSFHLIVQNVNDAPYFLTPQNSDTCAEDTLWQFTFAASDSDLIHQDVLTFLLADNPPTMAINSTTGKVTWTPDNAYVGVNQFYVIVQDIAGARDSLQFSLTVTNVNDAPYFIAQTDTIALEDSLFSLALKAHDIDVGDSLAFTIQQAPPGVNLNANLLTWRPDNAQVGSWQFTVKVSDRVGAAARDTFQVTVQNTNDAPRLVKTISSANLFEDSLWTFQFSAHDDDSLYGEKLTFYVQNHPATLSIVDSTGLVTWLPQNADVGPDSFIIIVKDKAQASDQFTFHLNVINTNDPPVILALSDTIAYEDSLFRRQVRYLDVDEGDSVHFHLVTAPTGMQIDSLSGWLSWLPTNDERDQDFNVIVKITDSANATACDTFVIHVINVNDPPVLSTLSPLTFAEDSFLIFPVSDWFSKVNDIDDADSTLSWQVKNFHSLTTQMLSDSVKLTSPLNWFGSDTGLIIVSDGALQDTAELVVKVLPVNDPPVIVSSFPAKISFLEDLSTSLALNKYVNDVDNDTSELYWSVEALLGGKKLSPKFRSNGMTYSVNSNVSELLPTQKSTAPAQSWFKSTIAISNSNGDSIIISIDHQTNIATISAMPNFFIDSVQFRFVVTDSSTIPPIGSDSAIVTIEVKPVNDAPALSNLPTITVAEDSIVQIDLTSWYQYVYDFDNPDSALFWTVKNGKALSAQQIGKTLTITPPANWFGKDTLQVEVSDGNLSDTSFLALTYYSVNDPPTFQAIPDTSLLEDDTLFIALNPFINDVETPTANLKIVARRHVGNAASDSYSIATELKTERRAGKISKTTYYTSSTDSITIAIDDQTHIAAIYGTPNFFTAPVPFDLTVYDDSLASASITLRIAIQSVNDLPVINTIPPIVFPEDSSYKVALSSWNDYVIDVETPDNQLKWQFTSDTTLVATYDSTLRTLTLTSIINWFGSANLTAIVTDADGGKDTALIPVQVTPRNDAPRLDSLLLTLHLYQTDTLNLLLKNYVHDPDDDADSLHWTFSPSKHVHYTLEPTHQILKIWCGYDWFGKDTIDVTVADPLRASDHKKMIVTVSDTTRPHFRFAIFQNQLASKFVTINVFTTEKLKGAPFIIINGDTNTVTTIRDSLIYYQTNYRIDSTLAVHLTTGGVDLADNFGSKKYAFGVATISTINGGILADPQGIMTFIFGPMSVKRDLCALYLPSEEPDSLFNLAKISSGVGPVAPEIEFLAPISALESPAQVLFNLAKLDINQQDAAYLGIYYWENGRWNYLKTYTGLETGVYWAYAQKPGKYQIQLNPANPVTVLTDEFSLAQNYPNPFNSQTTIKYVVGVSEFRSFEQAVQELKPIKVSINIYNLLGQQVKSLVNQYQLPGTYTVLWDGRNDAGQVVASGVYLYQALLGTNVFRHKMMVIK